MARKKQEKNVPQGPIKENIKTIGYCEEMETSYRDYALSVIVARALPDVRDGLKPVQRRVLYSMNELGLKHDKPYKKSARIVGDTMGKYHPHGDSSIYEAMVHMAQGWNYNIPLVDSHGNFGSIEGDGPAAQRYCVTGDTLINTGNGLIKIKDIIKNTVLNSDNDIDIKIKSIDGKINHASKLFNSGEHEVFEVILENGMSIKCTENHPLLVLNKKQKPVWKTISELKEGKICVIDKNFEETLFGTNNNLDEIPQIVQELLKKTSLPQEVLSGSKEYLFEFFSKFEKKFGNYSEDYMYITFNLKQLEMARQIQVMYHTLFGMLFNLSIKSNCILLEKVNTFSLEKYYTSKIIAINPLGKEVVYSIKVDSDCHSFIGNGFINHNTEARLAQYSEDCLLQDLNKEIVDFVPNFDETETEPSVCPAKVPNILVSGTEGIAVGMATKIPTHNLGEVIDGTIAYIDNEKITTKELMQYIKGPDFATGGIISNKKDLLEMYETGQGKIRIRAKVETEDVSNGKTNIVVTEIPYTMIGAIDKFMETVADLVRNKKAPDITDIYNQSGKEGIRIVIELRKNADVQKNINLLYKKARLEDTFGMIMLAVKDQEPIIYSLKGILKEYLEFTLENYRKKYQMLLEKELKNKEIKEGLVKAYDLIDLIIEILRGSKTTKQAKDCLMFGKIDNIVFKTKKAEKEASNLSFTELQATAILEMRLQKLIGLEIDLLNKELKECLKNIKTYEGILNSKTKMKNTIKSDLLLFKEKYAKPRKTQIKDEEAIVLAKEELVEQDYVLLMDRFGYIKLIDMPTYERNKESIPNDYKQYINIKNTDKLLIFTNTGAMHSVKALDIPLGKYKDKGVPIDNLSNYNSSKENIIFMCASNDIKDKMLLFVNNKGLAKKVEGSNFIVSKKTVDATKLLDDEQLLFVKDLNEEEEIILISKLGMFIRFKLEEIPQKGKTASGVRCIKLKDNDIIINAYIGDNKSSFEYQDNQLDFTRIKISKRDGVGTKIRL